MLESAMPLLHVSNAQAAQDFYTRLGFRIEYAHGPFAGPASPHADPCYMALSRDGVWIVLSSFSGDGVAGGVVTFISMTSMLFTASSSPPGFLSNCPRWTRPGARARCTCATRTAIACASSPSRRGQRE